MPDLEKLTYENQVCVHARRSCKLARRKSFGSRRACIYFEVKSMMDFKIVSLFFFCFFLAYPLPFRDFFSGGDALKFFDVWLIVFEYTRRIIDCCSRRIIDTLVWEQKMKKNMRTIFLIFDSFPIYIIHLFNRSLILLYELIEKFCISNFYHLKILLSNSIFD